MPPTTLNSEEPVNPTGGSLGAPPALPPSGLTLQLMGPGRHPWGPAATFHTDELRRQQPACTFA